MLRTITILTALFLFVATSNVSAYLLEAEVYIVDHGYSHVTDSDSDPDIEVWCEGWVDVWTDGATSTASAKICAIDGNPTWLSKSCNYDGCDLDDHDTFLPGENDGVKCYVDCYAPGGQDAAYGHAYLNLFR